MDFRKNDRGHGKLSHGISYFGPKISCCLKTGNVLLVIEQKCALKRLDFRHFLVMENLSWSWQKSLIFIA